LTLLVPATNEPTGRAIDAAAYTLAARIDAALTSPTQAQGHSLCPPCLCVSVFRIPA